MAATATIALGGRLVTVKADPGTITPRGRGKRGIIQGFSKAARKRILRLTNSIDRRGQHTTPLFCHLTYPKSFPVEGATFKRDLDTFLKRLRRAYPNVACIWKLEPQERGAPHYHLMMFNARFIDHDWIAQTWYEVVGSGDEKHLAAGTRIERARSWGGVGAYVAKYISKLIACVDWHLPGRFWGVHNRVALPVTLFVYEMTESEFIWARRIMRRYAHSHGFHFGGRGPDDGGTLFLDWECSLRMLTFIYAFLADR